MAFDSRPAPARANFPGGDAYAAEVFERSRRAAADRGLHYHPDIPYDDATGCRLDLYAPARAPADLPCLIFVHGGAFSLGCKEWMGFMAPAVTATAYRIVQECLTNIAKHANATQAVVTVRLDDNANVLHVSVFDDGKGGAVVDAGENATGLRGLDERVRAAGGTFSVSSPATGPTIVTAVLPCAS